VEPEVKRITLSDEATSEAQNDVRKLWIQLQKMLRSDEVRSFEIEEEDGVTKQWQILSEKRVKEVIHDPSFAHYIGRDIPKHTDMALLNSYDSPRLIDGKMALESITRTYLISPNEVVLIKAHVARDLKAGRKLRLNIQLLLII